MSPEINDKSYVVVKQNRKSNWFPKINSVLIFNHQKYGNLIKRLVVADNNGNHWFCGSPNQSLSKEEIGPIRKENIYGRVLLIISKDKIRVKI
tara:strand:+ start:1290 stop:1568 length:279 start_codon:yes stop_codon:yes gene_type:complete